MTNEERPAGCLRLTFSDYACEVIAALKEAQAEAERPRRDGMERLRGPRG